jgi:hypothetical protein
MTHEKKSRFTYANVASTLALIIAVGGGGAAVAAVAANSVGSAAIIDGAVKNAEVANNAVKGAEVADGSLTGSDLKNGSVSGTDVQDGSIGRSDFTSSTAGIVRGYAWMDQPGTVLGVQSTLQNDYLYNPKGTVKVTRTAVGEYDVAFGGLNFDPGHVVVTPYGDAATTCSVDNWEAGTVAVNCFDAAGAPVNSEFNVTVIK